MSGQDTPTTWRYVVMANGKGDRWGNFGDVPKHLYPIDGEPLVGRLVRQLLERTTGEIFISASDPRLQTPGATLHRPLRNDLELDRFVDELITERVCFLYGDTVYSDEVLSEIVSATPTELEFFATQRSIIAVKSGAPAVLRSCLARVRQGFLEGKLSECKGWQLLDEYRRRRGAGAISCLTRVDDYTWDLNTPDDAETLRGEMSARWHGEES